MILKKGNGKKRNKKVKINYGGKIKLRTKNRLSSKVWMFGFRGEPVPLFSPGSVPGKYIIF